jgi:hypothetical protein
VRDTILAENDANTRRKGRGGGGGAAAAAAARAAAPPSLDALVAAMQRDSATYCDEPPDAAGFAAFRATFSLEVRARPRAPRAPAWRSFFRARARCSQDPFRENAALTRAHTCAAAGARARGVRGAAQERVHGGAAQPHRPTRARPHSTTQHTLTLIQRRLLTHMRVCVCVCMRAPPQVVDNESFWSRYFFRLHALRQAHAPKPDPAEVAAAAAAAAAAASAADAPQAPPPPLEPAAAAQGCVRAACIGLV